MKYTRRKDHLVGDKKNIRGKVSREGMINHGSFGQQYDAQIASLKFKPGIEGENSGMFTKKSRVAIASYGPFATGEPMSMSLFFRTTQEENEMILVEYGRTHSAIGFKKDHFLLTLKQGNPILYMSPEKYLKPIDENQGLTNGIWNNIL
mmetsp:Transcript_3775/g.4949  ORF Transcript_3775/g.4949 Transcript_3775/m.4949 type:complete len:149 (-) Transcript_3775:695-1141(-)